MKIDKQFIQFVKFGFITTVANVIVSISVFVAAYPIISDLRLLVALLVIVPVSFALLFATYLLVIQQLIMKNVYQLNKPGIPELLKKNFRKSPIITFYLNWIFILMIFVPFVTISYVWFGYDNIYYHSYIFFICLFLNMYFGYYSTNVWYTRTYPLGRFGIPIAIQSLKSKIVSLILPVVVVVTVLVSIIVYFAFSRVLREQIDETMQYRLAAISETLDHYDDPSSMPWENMAPVESGGLFLVDGDGVLIHAPSPGEEGKKIDEIIKKGNQAEYLYENTITHLKNLRKSRSGQFEGVYRGKSSVFFTKKASEGNTVILVQEEKELYKQFYFTMFLITVGLIILTVLIWLLANRRLVALSRSMDSVIPAITRASKGDLAQKITMVKTRDILEDFTRSFISFLETIREVVGKSGELSATLLNLSRSIDEMGTYIRGASIEHAGTLRDSTDLIQGFSSSFSSIAERSGDQKELIQSFENAINNLNESMMAVSKNTGDVINSMKNMEVSANRGESLVENTFSGMQNIETFYGRILDVIQIISDIAD